MNYRPPFWLPGGHLQTIVPARLLPCPKVSYRRERWSTPDGDFIALDTARPEPLAYEAPIVVMFHGLEGHSRSHYARTLMRTAADRGWRAIVAHFRGCAGEPNQLLRAYHSGDSAEVDWVLRRIADAYPKAALHAVGFSLGGNTLAKWLGERGADANFVQAAAVIGAPLDLAAGGAALENGFNVVYAHMFLRTLRVKALNKAAQFGTARHGGIVLDTMRLKAARTLREFDNLYTAPVHGFADTDDYWRRASAKPWLKNVMVPLLLLNARNDPFVPASSLPGPQDVSAMVELDQPDFGGHIGFAQGTSASLMWLPDRIMRFFDGTAPATAATPVNAAAQAPLRTA